MGDIVGLEKLIEDFNFELETLNEIIDEAKNDLQGIKDTLNRATAQFEVTSREAQKLYTALQESERARKLAEEVALDKKKELSQQLEEEDEVIPLVAITVENLLLIKEGHTVIADTDSSIEEWEELTVKYVSSHDKIAEKFYVLSNGEPDGEFFFSAADFMMRCRIDAKQFNAT